MAIIFIFWVILAFVVAAMAENTTLGWWGGLLVSIFFSPIIGFIVLAFSDKQDNEKSRFLELAIKANKKGRYREARELYKKAILNNPKKLPVSCFNVSLIYARENDNEGTIFWLRKAMEAGYNNLEELRTNSLLATVRDSDSYKNLINEYCG